MKIIDCTTMDKSSIMAFFEDVMNTYLASEKDSNSEWDVVFAKFGICLMSVLRKELFSLIVSDDGDRLTDYAKRCPMDFSDILDLSKIYRFTSSDVENAKEAMYQLFFRAFRKVIVPTFANQHRVLFDLCAMDALPSPEREILRAMNTINTTISISEYMLGHIYMGYQDMVVFFSKRLPHGVEATRGDLKTFPCSVVGGDVQVVFKPEDLSLNNTNIIKVSVAPNVYLARSMISQCSRYNNVIGIYFAG